MNLDLDMPTWLYIDDNRFIQNYYYLIWKEKNVKVRILHV